MIKLSAEVLMDITWLPLAFGFLVYILTYLVPDVDLGNVVQKIRRLG